MHTYIIFYNLLTDTQICGNAQAVYVNVPCTKCQCCILLSQQYAMNAGIGTVPIPQPPLRS